ncbi:MAG: spore protease YyaC [Eubacteriales bacterium]|nr:spore protease YyaC [Eubacteriales bacterium]
MTFYINAQKENSSREISRVLKKCIRDQPPAWSELVFLCIGSDRMTGDCLGPYIGRQLTRCNPRGASVYGTLDSPVHALNLEEYSSLIRFRHPDALVIAIDACLGQKKHLGYVTIGNGALYPGAGVRKELPPVGDIHITGIVNISGILEQLTLQTTRLSTVISLGDTITRGILNLLPSEQASSGRSVPRQNSPKHFIPKQPIQML